MSSLLSDDIAQSSTTAGDADTADTRAGAATGAGAEEGAGAVTGGAGVYRYLSTIDCATGVTAGRR